MSEHCRKTSGHPTFCPALEVDEDEILEEQDFQSYIHLHMPHLYERVMALHNRVLERVVGELVEHYNPTPLRVAA